MPRKTTPHLSDALTEFLTIREAYMARNTLNNYRSQLRLFVDGVGDPQVHLLRAGVVERWFGQLVQQQQASSYNKVRTVVRTFLVFCSGRGLAPR